VFNYLSNYLKITDENLCQTQGVKISSPISYSIYLKYLAFNQNFNVGFSNAALQSQTIKL